MRIALLAPYPAAALLPEDQVKPKYRKEHPATWVRLVAEALAARPDTEVCVFVDSRAVVCEHRVERNGVRWHFLPKVEPIRSDPFLRFWPGCMRVRSKLTAFKPDVVQGFGTESGAANIAARLPYPSVFFIQGLAEMTRPFRSLPRWQLDAMERAEQETLHKCRAIVAETGFARTWALRHKPDALVRVIPHPLNPAILDLQPGVETARDALCISTLHAIKGVDTVIRAFALARRDGARLRIAGHGEDAEACHSLARELGVADAIDFLGHVQPEKIRDLLQASRVLLLGSRMDTSPNVVTEAHAAGLPVIATRAGGIPDMVEDGVDGHLVEVDDATGMAGRITELLANGPMAREMGARGREKVQVLNNPDRIASELMNLYGSLKARTAEQALVQRPQRKSIRSWKPVRQAAALLPPALRYGKAYRQWRQLLAHMQQWPRSRIDEWQLSQIRDLVHYAYANTEGYRELYRKAGVTPKDIRSMEDFWHFPTVTKRMIQENLAAFSVPGHRRRYGTTGGSTGIPLGFYYASENQQIEAAFIHDSWSWAGWRLGQRSAVLRGGFVGSPSHLFDYDPYHRELKLSSYYLTPETLPRYLGALRAYGIRVLQAYPSALNILCDLLAEVPKTEQPALDLILLGSENIYDWELQKAEATFPAARIFAWYGQAEQVILAPWCRQSRVYHARPLYSHTELLDDQGQWVEQGQEGELVGTNLHNRHTPFIRYRTMDRAIHGGIGCQACGRNFLLLEKITGRAQEFIVTGNGRYISMTAINMHDRIFDGLRQFQFLQEQAGQLTFRYLPKRPLARSELDAIHAGLMVKLGQDVRLDLLEVQDIPRTKAGKFRFLEQRLKLKYGE
jgi:phenylacetate-CoA ligase